MRYYFRLLGYQDRLRKPEKYFGPTRDEGIGESFDHPHVLFELFHQTGRTTYRTNNWVVSPDVGAAFKDLAAAIRVFRLCVPPPDNRAVAHVVQAAVLQFEEGTGWRRTLLNAGPGIEEVYSALRQRGIIPKGQHLES